MRGTVIMRICSALALAAALTCCSGDADSRRPEVQRARDARPVSDSRDYVNERRGFRVSLPPGWHRAELSLSPMVTDPVEILTVATFPLPGDRGLCRSLAAVPPDEAMVNLVLVAVGEAAAPSVSREAFRILDTLRFDPDFRPHWRSAG
jgi:hypothetical protein